LIGVAHAAEWSVQPSFSWSVDEDSNRAFLEPSPGSSEGGVLATEWVFKRSLENTQISIDSALDTRRYTDSVLYPDATEGTLTAALMHTGERGQLALTAAAADQSLLTSELYETGIVAGNSHRLTLQGTLSASFSRTERRELFLQANVNDARYYGLASGLPGFKYALGSFGERFFLSDRATLAVSAFGDRLFTSSNTPGSASYEAGLQAQYTRTLSERLHLDASVGESRRSLAESHAGFGTNASLSLTRDMTLGHVALSYTRSLTPYGIGSLVQVEQARASLDRKLGPYVSVDGNVFDIRNRAAAQFGIRRSFDGAAAGLSWRPSETWTLRTEVSAGWTEPLASPGGRESVHEWRAGVTMTWRPLQSTASR
jgi:hypothetical protein